MLIDHVTGGIMYPVVRYGLYRGDMTIQDLNKIYLFLRSVGRTAFPIFAFLLVEGFMHTKSRLRYALSLFIFGLISEIPFDLTFYSQERIFSTNIPDALRANQSFLGEQCNVYFTLFISFLVMWGIEYFTELCNSKNLPHIATILATFIVIFTGCLVAYTVNSDYDLYGVILISIFYLLRNREFLRLLGGYLFISNLSIEYASFPGFILMMLYNKKRGRNLGIFKYLFYIFYPAHLLAIYLIRGIIYG